MLLAASVRQQAQAFSEVAGGAMKEKVFNLFLFIMAGFAWWFRKYSNDQSLGMLEQAARIFASEKS
jgi:hypothetical protein